MVECDIVIFILFFVYSLVFKHLFFYIKTTELPNCEISAKGDSKIE